MHEHNENRASNVVRFPGALRKPVVSEVDDFADRMTTQANLPTRMRMDAAVHAAMEFELAALAARLTDDGEV